MNRILFGLVAFVAAFVGMTDAHAEMRWVNATQPSCENTCNTAGLSPVISGIFVNGFPFYVCAANARGEGNRAGYNLRPNWINACRVGVAGQEVALTSYVCLCQ